MPNFYSKNLCPYQISTPLYQYDTAYEMTLAFSTSTYSIIEALTAISQVKRKLNEWLEPRPEVQKTIFVTEYTKKKQPHVHIAICCDTELPIDFKVGIKKGLIRLFPDTRVTFSHVANKQSYNDYLEKDLYNNYTKSNEPHLDEFYFLNH